MERAESGYGGRDAQHDCVGAVSHRRDQDTVSRLGRGEDRRKHQARMRSAGLADRQRKRVSD